MPVPKPLRRFAKQNWMSLRRRLGVSGYCNITTNVVKFIEQTRKQLDRDTGIKKSTAKSTAVAAERAKEKMRLVEECSKRPGTALSREKSGLILIRPKKSGFPKTETKQVIAHEQAHTANYLACRKRGVHPDPAVSEFIAYWGQLEYMRQHNKAYFEDLLEDKPGTENEINQTRNQKHRQGLSLAIELFRRHPKKASRLKIIRFALNKGAKELPFGHLTELIEQENK